METVDKVIKPKLVFFQYIHEDRAKFVLLHKKQQIQCLSEFFNVTVIHQDCDYQQICDEYQPDITLFESGFAVSKSRIIKNTHVYPAIPKLGFYNGDPWCSSRSTFISDMEHWGITTFFTMSAPLAEYMPPEFSENLFTWLNCIDPDLYKDYGQSKVIPVYLPGSFTGKETLLYSWRQKVYKNLSENYPSLISPHLGYEARKASRMIYGEQYARILNASWFVPTCGAMAKEVVRKHFEIPACKSCLIAEKTSALEAAGFVDMQNCIFADENDVLDKLDYLFQNPQEIDRITYNGYQLVHSRHTLKQRDQIFQWFNLNKILKPGQKIVQESIFGPLIITEQSSRIKNSHIIGPGLDRVLLHQGDEKLLLGKYDEAEALYLQCLNYTPVMPEPKLRIAICKLYQGDVKAALEWITQPIQWSLVFSRALDPDPVDWAYFIIALLCQGKLNEAIKRANQFPSLSHCELDRTRWVINVLVNESDQITVVNSDSSKCRLSVQQLPDRSINEWIDHVCVMLEACKQVNLAEALKKTINSEIEVLKTTENHSDSSTVFLRNTVAKVYKNCSKKLNNIFEIIVNNHPEIKVKMYNLSITSEPFYIVLIKRIKSKLKRNGTQPLK